jgi:hypothetical protein
MDPIKGSRYLDFLDEFSNHKVSKKFKRAFVSINNKLLALKKRFPNSLEYDMLKDSVIHIKEFWDYAFNTIFEAMEYANEMELNFSHMLGENEKYAKILSCLGVTPMIYFSISEETLDFVIDHYSEIGILTIEQLVDIDIALCICNVTFQSNI